MKTAIGVVAALVVAGAAFYFLPSGFMANTAPQAAAYSWVFTEKGEDVSGAPQTEVVLNGRVVGTFPGTCAVIEESGWALYEGESSGVICWWAGGGREIGVFGNEVRVGDIDEGSAEVPGFRGNFQTLFTL